MPLIDEAFNAIATGDAELLRNLLAANDHVVVVRSNSSDCEEDGYTLLHFAAQRGNLDCTNILLEFKSVPNAVTSVSRSTPLHCAALHGHAEVVKCLLDAQADPLARDADGYTPLCVAIMCKHEIVVDLLRLWCSENLYLSLPSPPIHLLLTRSQPH